MTFFDCHHSKNLKNKKLSQISKFGIARKRKKWKTLLFFSFTITRISKTRTLRQISKFGITRKCKVNNSVYFFIHYNKNFQNWNTLANFIFGIMRMSYLKNLAITIHFWNVWAREERAGLGPTELFWSRSSTVAGETNWTKEN